MNTTFKDIKKIREMSINPNDKEEITATNLHPGHSIKHHYPGKDIPKGWHLMPDGSIMKDSDHPKENMSLAPKGKGREAAKKLYKEDEPLEEVSPAQRRARKQASLIKTMAKYRLAGKMGIPASQVNQRRSHPTRKKT